MSDYLSSLAARSINRIEVVRPRVPSIFEPLNPPSEGPIFGYSPSQNAGHVDASAGHKKSKPEYNNLPSEFPIHKRSEPRKIAGYEVESEGPIIEESPGLSKEHVNEEHIDTDVQHKEGNLGKSSSYSGSLLAHGKAMFGDLIGNKDDLQSEGATKKTEFKAEFKMENEPSGRQQPFMPLETLTMERKKGFPFESDTKNTRQIGSVDVNGSPDTARFKPGTSMRETQRNLLENEEITRLSPANYERSDNVIEQIAHKSSRSDEKTSSFDPSTPLESSHPLLPDTKSRLTAGIAAKTSRAGQVERLSDLDLISIRASVQRLMPVVGPITTKRIPAPEPKVIVTIGRIEVRAVQQSASSRHSRQASKAPSLEDYLRQRARGGIT